MALSHFWTKWAQICTKFLPYGLKGVVKPFFGNSKHHKNSATLVRIPTILFIEQILLQEQISRAGTKNSKCLKVKTSLWIDSVSPVSLFILFYQNYSKIQINMLGLLGNAEPLCICPTYHQTFLLTINYLVILVIPDVNRG